MTRRDSVRVVDSNVVMHHGNAISPMQKTLVIFTCASNPASQINTDFFLDFGTFSSEHVDFVMVCNGKYPLYVPKNLRSNLKIAFSDAATYSSDFDLWRDALKRVALGDYDDYVAESEPLAKSSFFSRRGNKKKSQFDHRKHYSASFIINLLRKKYKHFVLLSSTLRGPFLQTFVRRDLWPFYLTQYITQKNKLVGLIANYDSADKDEDTDLMGASSKALVTSSAKQSDHPTNPYHVQALVLAFDLKFLILTWDSVFESTTTRTHRQREILATQLLHDAGHTAHVISWMMRDMDPFGDLKNMMNHVKHPSECKISGYDSFLPNCYFGVHPNIFEFMFMRTKHPDWLSPASLRKVVSMHTRFHYNAYFKCSSPDYSTYGASCKTKGAWMYRDEHFQCANLIPTALDIKNVNRFLSERGAETVIDIGGGLGHHCFELLKKDVKECTVIEPAPLYGCLRDRVAFIRGDVLSPHFELPKDIMFDAAMIVHTVKHMHLNAGNIPNMVNFLKRNVRTMLIVSPIDEDFIVALQQKMAITVQKHSELNIAVLRFQK